MTVTIRTEGRATADSIRAGLRAVGPNGSHGRLAPVIARCAYALETPSRATFLDGLAVQTALDEALDLVVLVL